MYKLATFVFATSIKAHALVQSCSDSESLSNYEKLPDKGLNQKFLIGKYEQF